LYRQQDEFVLLDEGDRFTTSTNKTKTTPLKLRSITENRLIEKLETAD
jgi:hypothetical protein